MGRSILRWWNALLAREGARRPPRVSPTQLRWIADTVRDRTPEQLKFEFGFGFGLWTLRVIGSLIQRQFQMRLTLPTLGRVMRQPRFTARRPLCHAYQQDGTLVEGWRTEEYRALQARAKARGALSLFADEAGMCSDYHAGNTRAPRGRTALVRTTGQRVSAQTLSAVGAGGQL